VADEKPESPSEKPEPYERVDFIRDLKKVARRLRPDESEKKKPKGRRSSG
jgi:hypothetical protein